MYRKDIQKISKIELQKFSSENLRVGSISIVNNNGKEGIRLTATASGGMIYISDQNGSERLRLYASSNGFGYLRIFNDENNETHCFGSYRNNGGPFIHLCKNKDIQLLKLQTDSDGGYIGLI